MAKRKKNKEKKTEEKSVAADEDWKEHVKAQDAALDEQIKQEKSANETDSDVTGSAEGTQQEKKLNFPAATFSTLLGLLSTQAMVAMGLVANPVSGKPERDLDLAKHFIDLLGVLDEKTKRNLTGQEADLLEATLHQLRMAYVEFSKMSGQTS